MPESRGRSALAPFSFPPLCKGRVGGVELNAHKRTRFRHPSRRVSTSPHPSLYLRKGVYFVLLYSSLEPNSPILLRVPKPGCKHGAFGSASRQPAQLPGPDEPASMARPGVFGEAPQQKGASYDHLSNLCGY
jgi:hypothetical protein